MSASCTNVLDLGCFLCGQPGVDLGIDAAIAGTYTAWWKYGEAIRCVEFDLEIGEDVIIPLSGLLENYVHTFYLTDPNGDRVTVTQGSTVFDCFTVTLKPKVIGSVGLLTLSGVTCENLTDETKGLTLEQRLECILPEYDFSDSGTLSALTPAQVIDLIAALCGGGGGGDVTIFFSDGLTVVQVVSAPGSFTIPQHYITAARDGGPSALLQTDEYDQDFEIALIEVRDNEGDAIDLIEYPGPYNLRQVNIERIAADGVTVDILGTHGITGLDGAAFQLVPAGRIPRLAIRDTGDTTDLEFIAGGLTKYVLKNFRVYYSDSSDVIQVLEFPIELLNSGSFEWGQFQYGGEYIPISKFRVLYSDGTTQYLAADIAFADITLPLVLAKNSLGTTLASGEVDEVLNLPDVIHTDSDGTPVPTPCGVAFVATPCGGGGNVTIYYSDGSTIVISVAPGGSYTIAKHNIYRENAAGVPELVIAQEFDEDHTVPRLAIRSTDGGTVLYYLAGETATEDLPQVRIDYDFYDESGVGSQLISLDVIGLDTGELTLSDRMQRIAVLCSNAVNFLFWMDVRANREATSGGTYLGYRALIQPKVRIEYHRAGDNAIQTLLDADIDSYLPMPSDVYHLGAPAEIPRITIFYSDGVTVYVYLDITLPNHTLPQVVVKNSLGTTVDFGEVDEILAAPDASWTLKDTLANVLNSGAIASGSSADIEAPDATYSVKNSESTELAAGSIVSGGTDTVLLADITLYDSDGAELSKPAGVDVTCTVWQDVVSVKTWAEIEAVLSPAQITAAQASICAVPSGILYRFGYTLWSGESASFGAGSEGNLFSSGWYDFTPPAYPASFARLDPGAVNPWKTLLDSNVFGNLNRFTDTAGGQTYADNLVIDHLTGLMFYRVLGSAATWATALSNAEASTQGGFTDWHLPSEKILMMLLDYGRGTSLLNYLPFSISGDSWTSTTRPDSTTAARCFRSATASNIVNLTKTSTLTYILCRKHYV